MRIRDLTGRAGPATSLLIKGPAGSVAKKAAALLLVSVGLAGCITVNAPEEPIVIELNVNIRQEVIYRLAQDAGDTIEDNADIF